MSDDMYENDADRDAAANYNDPQQTDHRFEEKRGTMTTSKRTMCRMVCMKEGSSLQNLPSVM